MIISIQICTFAYHLLNLFIQYEDFCFEQNLKSKF